MAATSMHDDVLLDSEECQECETDCAHADGDSLVGSRESTRSGNVGLEVEEELSSLAIQYWAEGVWTGTWHHEEREASLRQIR